MISQLWTALVYTLRRREVSRETEERVLLAAMLLPTLLLPVSCLLADFLPDLPAAIPPAPWFEPSTLNVSTESVANSPSIPWGLGLLTVYLIGFFLSLLRLVVHLSRLLAIESNAAPRCAQPEIRVTEHPITPFVGPRGSIVIPDLLVERLSSMQLELIEHHERAHILRRDPEWFVVLAVIDALFWFNPFVRRQVHRCRLAAELSVDALVGRRDPRLYAETLIDALKFTGGFRFSSVPAAAGKGEMMVRISQVLRPRPVGAIWPRLGFVGVLALVPITLQVKPARGSETPVFTVAPLDGRLTSKFGRVPGPDGKLRNHIGIDIAAPQGTPIRAPAPGTVLSVRTSRIKYGNLLVLDHGGGFVTRYAHLKSFEVKVGDRVQAGDVIAQVGNTGYSTGPHLHFEVLASGKHIDPHTRVPLPKHFSR
ncbi:MAG: M23/M56 family metallopeptidase [Myxococcota bacterium]